MTHNSMILGRRVQISGPKSLEGRVVLMSDFALGIKESKTGEVLIVNVKGRSIRVYPLQNG